MPRKKPPAPKREISRADTVAEALRSAGWSRTPDQIRTLPSPFLSFNHATRSGGVPLGKIVVVFGPSHQGKTAFALGLARAFLERDLAVGYLDVERALDPDFVRLMTGRFAEDWPSWGCPDKLRSFEDVIAFGDKFFQVGRSLREFDDGYPGSLMVIDSLDYLIPKSMLTSLLEDSGKHKPAVDAKAISAGNFDQRKANVNRAFLYRLVPMAADASTTVVIIAHNTEWKEPGHHQPQTKARGGKALKFASWLEVEVTQTFVNETGATHKARIRKNRGGFMDGKWTESHFWMSRDGLDFVQDAVVTGIRTGVITSEGGGWFDLSAVGHDGKIQGEAKVLDFLRDRPDMTRALRDAVHATYAIDD